MGEARLNVAVIHEVFFGDGAEKRLQEALGAARDGGADLVALPELPLDPWVPATRRARDEDSEPPGGPRATLLANAAREAGIGILGGAIVAENGARRNRALLLDREGRVAAQYDKLHIPSEEGFWESDHYGQGDALTPPTDRFGLRVGLQICSDMQRPQTVTALAAMGAEVILAPRATPRASHERWRTILRASAMAGACYVISINRPRPEGGAPIGSPSLAIAPDGGVLLETEDAMSLVSLNRGVVEAARGDYPGYLDVRAELYARTWDALSR